MNLYQQAKTQLKPSVHSWDRVNLESRNQIGHTHFLTMPNQQIFDQLLIFVNLYQHAKNEVVSAICSGEIVDLQFLQSDWLKMLIFQEQDFSKK